MSTTALLWLRRDLRLTDHPALQAALASHAQVVPVFIADFDAEAPWVIGAASRWWLHHSLAALQSQLARRGSPLILRRGPSLDVLRQLLRETGARAVYWHALPEPAANERDRAVATALEADGIEVNVHEASLWHAPHRLRNGSGEPYRVFTPFWRRLATELPPLHVRPAPSRIPGPPSAIASLPLASLELLPTIRWDREFPTHWQPGEAGALAALARFVDEDLKTYATRRDLPADDASSRLSPHLHYGEISPQQLRAALLRMQALEASDAYLRQLGWREFAHHLLWNFPHTPASPLNVQYAHFAWRQPRDYAADLRAWQRGRTGIPLVDAGMRQLWRSGGMHNRVRMVTASFLVKNLLIPWQEGARWFWDTLVDADLANNTLGWQWVAGCGADAAPYFRVFNPVLQSQKFDAAGRYIRRWVPELAALPDAALHAPWLAKPAVLQHAGLRLDIDYPLPIVDLSATRQRALDAYARLRQG